MAELSEAKMQIFTLSSDLGSVGICSTSFSETLPKRKTIEDKPVYYARMRESVLSEIASTEESYINSLQNVTDLYIRPLSSRSNNILDEKEFDILFGNLETLITLNQRFLSDFQVHMKYPPHQQLIGGLFLDFTPFFKMYSNYVQN